MRKNFPAMYGFQSLFCFVWSGVIQQYHWPSPTASKRSFFFKCVIHMDQLLLVELRSDSLIRLQHVIVDHVLLILVFHFFWLTRAFTILKVEISFLKLLEPFFLCCTAFSSKAEQIISFAAFFSLKREKKAMPQMLLFE